MLISRIRSAKPSISISKTPFLSIPMLISASAVSISGPRMIFLSTPSAESTSSASFSCTKHRPGMMTVSSSFDKSASFRSSIVIRQAISFFVP